MNTSRLLLPSLLCASLFAGVVRAGMPPLLEDALRKQREQEYRWAFTESIEVRNGKGEVHDTIVVRYDPSKPYDEQYTPISVDGKEPAKSLIHELSLRGEDEARERQKKFEKGDDNDQDTPEIEISDEKGIVELREASPLEENELFTTYKVPIRPKTTSRFAFDSVQLLIKVSKAERALSSIRLVISSSVRINLTARIRGAEISGTFTRVDPAYPPQITSAEVQANIKFLFAKANERVLIRRTDFKHVKPYDERFVVKTGPLKTLGF